MAIMYSIKEIKEFIKQNLLIVVELETKYGSGNSAVVGLQFVDEEKPFTETTIYIPDDCDV